MKILFFDDDENILDVIEEVEGVEWDENSIKWNNGQAIGLNASFLILEDNETDINENNFRGKRVSEEARSQDRKNELRRPEAFNIQQEMKRLKEEVAELRQAQGLERRPDRD
jgi:hypothetical protein